MKLVYVVLVYNEVEMKTTRVVAVTETLEKAQEIKQNHSTFGGHIKSAEYIAE